MQYRLFNTYYEFLIHVILMMLNFIGCVIIPDLIPLLILVLLGELLSPLEDLGALGLACDLRKYKSL